MAWFNFKTGPKELVAKDITDFTAPKSRTALRNRSFVFEGYNTIHRGTTPATVGSYASPFAPKDLASLGVLQDARNAVAF